MNDNIDVNKKQYLCFYRGQINEDGLWSKFWEKEFGKTKYDGKTPLHLAVEMDDTSIIKLLLEKKDIDINIEDLEGKKPINYSKSDEVKKLLSK